MGYRKDDIERLKASLAELPQIEHVEVNKQEAVRLLASTIQGLQGKGYRLDKIAELVSARGVTISATTLKSYLHRVKPRLKAAAKTARKPTATQRATPSEDAHSCTKEAPPAREPEAGPVRAGGTKTDVGGAVAVAPRRETRANGSVAAGGTVVATGAISPVDAEVAPPAPRATSAVIETKLPVDTAKASFTPRDDSDDI
jgi:hypothetical protein